MLEYFERYRTRFNVAPVRVQIPVSKDIGIIVVIPCYCEPAITETLDSLRSCMRPSCSVEVFILVNNSVTASDDVVRHNASTYKDLCKYAEQYSSSWIHFIPIIVADMPSKYAGVGLARKIAMDEACYRFAAVSRPDGIIVSCDADTYVDPTYFVAIEQYYKDDINRTVANIYFEHPLAECHDARQIDAIAQYELHLRYYVEQLRAIEYPFAFHTVGSCFSIRMQTYCLHGGMNKRQAGEDFYFLQKIAQSEHIGNIATTCVYPSARISMRVPFGTGPVLCKLLEQETFHYMTFAPQSFSVLAHFFSCINTFAELSRESLSDAYDKLPKAIHYSVSRQLFVDKITEIQQNTSSLVQFRRRFFAWFDGFMVFRYLNESHNACFKKVPVIDAASCLYGEQGHSVYELLQYYRTLQKITE